MECVGGSRAKHVDYLSSRSTSVWSQSPAKENNDGTLLTMVAAVGANSQRPVVLRAKDRV